MTLIALPEERLLEEPPPERPAAARTFALIVFFCFLAHALAIFLFGRYGGEDGPAPAPEAIPVEIVMEPPPPPKPPPPPSKQEQPAKQMIFDEKEATDAPKASDQKAERDVRVEAPKSLDAKLAAQPAQRQQNSEKAVAASAAEDWRNKRKTIIRTASR